MKSSVRVMVVAVCLISAAMLSRCGGGSSQPSPRLTIAPAALPNGTSETPYSQTLQATGGVAPFTWTVSAGALPHNVALSSSATNVVTISGTPDTAAQGLTFTVRVTDSASQSATQSYTVSILLDPDTLTLSPASLSFAPQLTGSVSGAQTETVTNSGTSAVAIASVALSGNNASDFSQNNSCGSSLAAGADCTINVTFTPSHLGPRSAAITITDSTAGSPHSVSLGGMGLTSGPNVTWSATSLTFATQLVGTTSPAQSVTLSNYGTATLSIAGIAATTNFDETDTCGSSLASAANCTINITFTPSASGTRTGTLSVTDNAPGSPQTISLSGTGTTNALTGSCVIRANNKCQYALDLTACPFGAQAITPQVQVCGLSLPPVYVTVDTSRACFVSSRQGQCVVH
jgi:hypothetical protein